MEKVASTAPATGRTTGTHVFLRLIQPLDESCLPENQIAKAGETYTIPFTFVVPERLLPQICTHRVSTDGVQEAHLNVPPTFGDAILSNDGTTFLNDQAPDMAKISYKIRVKVLRYKENGKRDNLVDKAIKVRIVPAVDEQPPLNVPEDSQDYELRKEKDVKRGIFKLGKTGRLAVEAAQPSSLRLHPVGSQSDQLITTMATVNLRFDPMEESDLPPRLGSLQSKLRVVSLFGAHPFPDMPSKSVVQSREAWDNTKGVYAECVGLSQRRITEVGWQKHNSSTDLARRNSALSTASSSAGIPESSQTYAGGSFYTAQVLVPISLPSNKTFPPSFHSCLISRVYCLELQVSYHPTGATVSSPSIMLRLPIQVSAAGNPHARPSISHAEAEAIAAREATDEMMRSYEPRAVSLPSPEYTETSTSIERRVSTVEDEQGPPGYSSFLGARRAHDDVPRHRHRTSLRRPPATTPPASGPMPVKAC